MSNVGWMYSLFVSLFRLTNTHPSIRYISFFYFWLCVKSRRKRRIGESGEEGGKKEGNREKEGKKEGGRKEDGGKEGGRKKERRKEKRAR